MKNRYRFKFILMSILVSFVFGGNISAQVAKGDAAYEQLKYQDAIKYYERALKKKSDYNVKVKLANSYRLTNQYEQAEKYYAQVASQQSTDPELNYFYAQMLQVNGKNTEALKWAEIFNAQNPKDRKGVDLIAAIRNQQSILNAEEEYTVTTAPFNSDASDFSPVFFQDGLLFISDREGKTNPWTGRAYTSIFSVDLNTNKVKPLKGNISGAYNDGPLTLTNNGNTMYFSRNNSKGRKGKDDVIDISIFSAGLNGDQWELSEPFPQNSTEYSNLHPTISPDGKLMVFASDKEGGVGKKDLYISHFGPSGWSIPNNLGAIINSPANEAFPFFANDGTLYFASDGLQGLGGLDIYRTNFDGKFWIAPENVGSPLNSSKDDFGLISLDGLKTGYFSSNRNSSDGTDDIFRFEKIAEGNLLNGMVVDLETEIPLPGVELTLTNQITGMKQTTISKLDGRFQLNLDPASDYIISGTKNNIQTETMEISTKTAVPGENLFIRLTHNDPRFTLNGKAINKKSSAGVSGVQVKLFNLRTSKEYLAMTQADGSFSFQLEQNTDYQISGEKDGYFTSAKEASTKGLTRSTTLYVKLFLMIEEVIIGKEIKLDNSTFAGETFSDILYDFNKSNIRNDAAYELDKLVRILKNNNSMRIELNAHTDARGKNDYNQQLSQRRADSAVAYIVSRGIQPYRLVARGYGENQIYNHCKDGINCSEAEHQINRRTEITVTDY